jgi:hypothetical protein
VKLWSLLTFPKLAQKVEIKALDSPLLCHMENVELVEEFP